MHELEIDLSKPFDRLNVLTKYLVNSKIAGNYRSIFRGRGLEFEGYREYNPRDDSKLIDWKATKRAAKTLIKQFKEERNLNIFFLVDVSSTMVCSSTKKLKSEYAAEFVASFAYVMLNAGDSVGFALFNDSIIKEVIPSRRKHQFYALLKNLANPTFYGGGYDLANSLKFTMASLPSYSVLIIVSDFIGLTGEWERYLKVAAEKFDVICVRVMDPVDRVLPADTHQVMLRDPISGKQLLISPNQIRGRYKKYIEDYTKKLKEVFLRSNCDFMDLSTDKSFVEELIKFFEKRTQMFT